jgi:hypothetical protein
MRNRFLIVALSLLVLAAACGTEPPTGISAADESAAMDGGGYMGSGDRH